MNIFFMALLAGPERSGFTTNGSNTNNMYRLSGEFLFVSKKS